MTAPRWAAIVDALARCEDAGPTACGVLHFVPAAGGILVENGRICWAATPGLRRRLTDLLREGASLRNVDLDQLHARCVAEGRPLGRVLLEEGLIAPAELQAALRRHSAESLVDLCSTSAPAGWTSRSGRGYSPRTTFRPFEVLLDVVARFHPQEKNEAAAELAGLDGPCRQAVAYLRVSGNDMIPVGELGGATVRQAGTLLARARALASATRELAAVPSYAMAASGDGGSVSVWSKSSVLYVVASADRPTTAAVAARRMAL